MLWKKTSGLPIFSCAAFSHFTGRQPRRMALPQASDAGHKLWTQVMASLPLPPAHRIHDDFTVPLVRRHTPSDCSFPAPWSQQTASASPLSSGSWIWWTLGYVDDFEKTVFVFFFFWHSLLVFSSRSKMWWCKKEGKFHSSRATEAARFG